MPRPPADRGGGELILTGGSTLAALRAAFCGMDTGEAYVLGSAGTGGGSS